MHGSRLAWSRGCCDILAPNKHHNFLPHYNAQHEQTLKNCKQNSESWSRHAAEAQSPANEARCAVHAMEAFSTGQNSLKNSLDQDTTYHGKNPLIKTLVLQNNSPSFGQLDLLG